MLAKKENLLRRKGIIALRGMTSYELADKMGITPAGVTHIINLRNLNRPMQEKMVAILDISLVVFFPELYAPEVVGVPCEHSPESNMEKFLSEIGA